MQTRVTSRNKRVKFQIDSKRGDDVYLSGSFHDWNGEEKKMKDKKGDGHYSISLNLPCGEHKYKFLINKEWQIDPDCENWRMKVMDLMPGSTT